MKVKELMRKVHLFAGQHTKVNDITDKETYVTYDRYDFGDSHCSKPTERILDMKVNSFQCSDYGLIIWAE